jgi:UDP-N-acetylmuramate: L-alanyl-gamma-D-glutamyl-meso-diaminopimelate ligase
MKKAHIIGVAGVAMSATAKLLQDAGWQVSGSDDDFYPPASEYVEKLGIDFHHGYNEENIPKDVDLVIIGRNAKLVPETNTEVARAHEMGSASASHQRDGIAIQSFPEIIAELMRGQHRIVVAGSYGKSTVTSLAAWILEHAGKDPSYFIGAYPIDMEYTSRKGTGEIAIIEGDEYPTAHWDDSSKFLHFNADDVLLTSIEHDHVNVFPTYKDYVAPFITLLKGMPKHGLLVACTDNGGVSDVLKHAPQYITYGLTNSALWRAENIEYGETTTCDLTHDGEVVTKVSTHLLGSHNVQNIVGVAALLLTRELVTPGEFSAAIAQFSGVRRRLNKITATSKVPAYEGFGSSYEKARAAIEAIQLHYPDKKQVVLFEPHTFSWRNRGAFEWYDTVFKDVAEVLVFEPATQGADTHTQLTQEEIVARTAASGVVAKGVQNEEEVRAALKDVLTDDSVLLVLTSGNVHGILDSLPAWLDSTFQ